MKYENSALLQKGLKRTAVFFVYLVKRIAHERNRLTSRKSSLENHNQKLAYS